MGCDIHGHIEHRAPNHDYWQHFCALHSMPRDYLIFGALANVRNTVSEANFKPKGLPADISWRVKDNTTLYIIDKTDTSDQADGEIIRKTAEDWIANSEASYADEHKLYIWNPDYHSHSWLTPDEYAFALNNAKQTAELNAKKPYIPLREDGTVNTFLTEYFDKLKYSPEHEYEMLNDILQDFSKRNIEARFVFWFDN